MSNLKLIEIADLAVEQCLEGDKLDMPKFVQVYGEMIVQECIKQVWYTRDDGINGNVSEIIKERIKDRFGVNNATR